MKRIKKFGVYQTSKVCGIIYFIGSAVVFIPFGLLFSSFGGDNNPFAMFTGTMLFILPFVYGVIGFIVTAVGCVIYNIIANWVGGIEVEVESDASSTITGSSIV